MLRLVDIVERTAAHIIFQTEELEVSDLVPYVVFDTSTGVSIDLMEDYIGWRSLTVETSTGSGITRFTIDNTNLYPSYGLTITDYTTLNPRLFKFMTLQEYDILTDVLIRFDLVRKRLPNPGLGLSSTNGIGENGTVAYSGGHDKKMTVDEITRMIVGSILEINGAPPRTGFWPMYQTLDADKITNPYQYYGGIPNDMVELVKMGTLIRCLMAMGLLEVDISFSTSDSGLQITFDRAEKIKGWRGDLLTEYKEMKTLVKWNHANHAGVGVGTTPFAATGIWGTMLNNVTFGGGNLGLSSILGFTSRGNAPL